MAGACTARAEAQVMRLACLYAVLDCSSLIRVEHLTAALAVWQYCEDSAGFIFGDSTGDSLADEILTVLKMTPPGMTRNDIREHFQRHKRSGEIDRALAVLEKSGLAKAQKEITGGRPSERWFLV